MRFTINISLSDRDYLDFNKFVIYHKRKKLINLSRLIVVLLYFVFAVLFALIIKPVPLLLFAEGIWLLSSILMLVFTKQYHFLSVKKQFKSLNKKGKKMYSSVSFMEFFDDYFCETTENEKQELKYEAIESVSVVKEKVIYLHKNDVIAYMLPVSCLGSKEQYETFINFLKTKCPKIDFYDKI